MKRELMVPVAIIFAGIVIAIAVYQTHKTTVVVQNGNPQAVAPVDPSTDHILGNPKSPVMIVEYADIDSEYSKSFQNVLEQVMTNYGSTGKVAWTFRQFPLIATDSFAEQHAEAAECVASIGTTDDFFKFIDALQTAAPADTQFDPSGYDAVVTNLGLSSGSFDDCMSAHTYRQKVADDLKNAGEIGASGSPYTVMIVQGQKPFVISGALPYAAMKQVIDTSLSKVLSST